MQTMLSTLDLLYIVLAFAIVITTGILAWALVEVARFFHQTNKIVNQAREGLEQVEKVIKGSLQGLVVQGGKAIVSYLNKRKKK